MAALNLNGAPLIWLPDRVLEVEDGCVYAPQETGQLDTLRLMVHLFQHQSRRHSGRDSGGEQTFFSATVKKKPLDQEED